MTDSISQEQAQEMLRWLNKNRDTVLDLYKNQWFFVTWYGSIGWHKSTKSLSGKRLN